MKKIPIEDIKIIYCTLTGVCNIIWPYEAPPAVQVEKNFSDLNLVPALKVFMLYLLLMVSILVGMHICHHKSKLSQEKSGSANDENVTKAVLVTPSNIMPLSEFLRELPKMLKLGELVNFRIELEKGLAEYSTSDELQELSSKLETPEAAAEQTLLEELGALRDSSWAALGVLPPCSHAKKKGEECSHLHLETFGDKALGGDNEAAVFVCSSCHTTITEESQRRRVSREKESMKRLGEQDVNFRPVDSAGKGLTIGFLLLLCEKFNPWDVSTRDVVLLYVVPMTSHLRCRFVDLPIF
eukprot:gene30357-40340_t